MHKKVRHRIIIMGAAGRDFHLFNCLYRENDGIEVVAFTDTQIAHIEDRRYAVDLADSLYPDGIPIVPEEDLEELLDNSEIDEVIFAYSDVSMDYINERQEKVRAKGIAFNVFDIEGSMLPSSKPIIAITAVRTG